MRARLARKAGSSNDCVSVVMAESFKTDAFWETMRRYQVTGMFSNFLRISFSSLHATRPVRTSLSVAVTL